LATFRVEGGIPVLVTGRIREIWKLALIPPAHYLPDEYGVVGRVCPR
jgi:hypothetical protein